MNKVIIGSFLVTVVAITGTVFLLRRDATPLPASTEPSANVSLINGKQVVQIQVKGGYQPMVTTAAAGVPTTLSLATNGTFDCSAALTIPSLGFRKSLPSSGVTSIDVPQQSAGTTINGICAMGMYHFAINFR